MRVRGHAPCATEEELCAFYERLGGLAAVLTILDATDMHSENVVAAGPSRLLVDLECLFQPRAYVHLDTDGEALPAADEFYTVLRTGFCRPARGSGAVTPAWIRARSAR